MPTFRLKKLVRNGIIDHQKQLGQTPHFKKLDPAEHKRALILKLIEEAEELLKAFDENKDTQPELADVSQVFEDLLSKSGFSVDDIAAVQAARKAKMGGFDKGLYLDTLDVPEGDEWVKYYRAEPDKYEEL